MMAVGNSKSGKEEVKRLAISRFRELEKKIETGKDDLVILKSKLILLKRFLLGNDAVRQANEIITPPAPKF